MKRKLPKIETDVDLTILADFFYFSGSQIRKLFRSGVKLDNIYKMLSSDKLTFSQKRRRLFDSNLEFELKENLFERFMGDRTYDYNNSQNYTKEFKI